MAKKEKNKHVLSVKSTMGRRNLFAENHWEPFELGEFKITKPTVICLSGNGTITDLDANAFCKAAMNFLGLYANSKDNLQDVVDIVGVVYAAHNDETGGLIPGEAAKIVEGTLLPLCVRDGQLLPMEEIIRNMSNITLFSYCKGSYYANAILGDFAIKMRKYGLDEQQVDKILSQVVQIIYSPYSQFIISPTVNIISFQDNMQAADGLDFEEEGKYYGFKNLEVKLMKPKLSDGKFVDSINIYSKKLLNNTRQITNEHDFSLLDRKEGWTLAHPKAIGSKNAELVSRMTSYALSRVVSTSVKNYLAKPGSNYIPKPTVQQLHGELLDIKRTFSNEELGLIKFEY